MGKGRDRKKRREEKIKRHAENFKKGIEAKDVPQITITVAPKPTKPNSSPPP